MGICESQRESGGGIIKFNHSNVDIKSTQFYDVIIPIQSIIDITKGWEIKFSDKYIKNYENFSDEKILKIGLIGNSNKGKSFIISKLSKINLPVGASIKTEGLCIKYPDLGGFHYRRIAFLDSAGLETPVLKTNFENNENDIFEKKSKEKMITERFLQDYIFYNSDILIIVVGMLTSSEQKIINKIKIKLKREKLIKSLFIIHNLRVCTNVKEVQRYIEEVLLKSVNFELEKCLNIDLNPTIQKGICFHEKNEEQQIYHLIFAYDYSEAGNYYNEYTLNFIMKSLSFYINFKGFDIVKTIKERFLEQSRDLFEIPLNEDLVFANEPNTLIKLESPKELKLKQFFIDEFGFQNMKINGYEPNYSYSKTNDAIIVKIEIPGNFTLNSSIQYSGEYVIIQIDGKKELETNSDIEENNIYNKREFGKFSLIIPIKQEDFIIKNEKPGFKAKDGIITLSYKIEKGGKQIIVENEEK